MTFTFMNIILLYIQISVSWYLFHSNLILSYLEQNDNSNFLILIKIIMFVTQYYFWQPYYTYEQRKYRVHSKFLTYYFAPRHLHILVKPHLYCAQKMVQAHPGVSVSEGQHPVPSKESSFSFPNIILLSLVFLMLTISPTNINLLYALQMISKDMFSAPAACILNFGCN